MTFNLHNIHFLPHNKSWKFFPSYPYFFLEIGKIFMEFQNSNHLQRGPLFLPMLQYFKFWAAAVPYFLLPLYFVLCTKISCKFSWNFDIPIICNLVLFFSMARTNSFYFGFTLNLFQIMGTRCSLFCVTFVCCPLH